MKIYLSIILLFISSLSVAQQFKTSFSLLSGISWYSSNNSEINNKKIGFTFSAALKEEFILPKIFSIGIEIEYLNTNGSFQNHLDLTVIPEIHNSFRHIVSIHSLDLPILLKVRTNNEFAKGINFYIGTGLSYIIQTDRTIDIVTTYDYSPDKKDISTVTKGSTNIKSQNNKLGTIGILGIGKNLLIRNKTFFCEVKYRFDFNKWTYSTVGDPVNTSFGLKRQCLFLGFGITF